MHMQDVDVLNDQNAIGTPEVHYISTSTGLKHDRRPSIRLGVLAGTGKGLMSPPSII